MSLKYLKIHVIIFIGVLIATELLAMGGGAEDVVTHYDFTTYRVKGGSVEKANGSPNLVPGLDDNWFHYNQGIVNIKWKSWAGAEDEFNYYLKHPEMHKHMFGIAHFGKGLMYQAMGNLEKALVEFQLAADNDLHPALRISDKAYSNMGAIYFRQKDYPDAVNAYSKAVENNPKSGAAHYWLGMSYLRTGEIEKAEKEADSAKKLGIPFTALPDELAEKRKLSKNNK
jgi:tetratricopeptide (TPR) repeat protein